MTAALGALTLYLACRFHGRSLRLAGREVVGACDRSRRCSTSLPSPCSARSPNSLRQPPGSRSWLTRCRSGRFCWHGCCSATVQIACRRLRLLLCATGLAILIYPLAATKIALGIWLALLTGVCWAGGTIYLKWAQIKADPMGVASWQVTIAFVVTAAFMLIFEGRSAFRACKCGRIALYRFDRLPGQRRRLWIVVRDHSPPAGGDGVARCPRQSGDRRYRVDPDCSANSPPPPILSGSRLIFAASACVLSRGREPESAKP